MVPWFNPVNSGHHDAPCPARETISLDE